MNLVQINERLKDLPMQVIQQYANGMNPEVPPYLALGELQRRELSQKQMATAQGGMQGPQPSVKEQVEQKAGLMAAQGLQQQQMLQQMAQPRGPMPSSDATPQPEAQPTMTAASGGLARAPVDFNFQHGGIVAFDEGGKTDKYETRIDKLYRENQEAAAKPAQSELESLLAARERYVQANADTSAIDQAIATLQEKARAPISRPTSQMTPQQMENPAMGLAASRPTSQMTPQQMEAQVKPAAPIADLKALAEQKQRQQTPRPVPAPAAATEAPATPAQPAPQSMDAMLRAQLAETPKARTMAELLAEQKAAREGAGMTEPAGAAQMERLRKMQEQYEGSKPSGLDDLIRIFGQSGQYKGLSGLAPAYTANQQQKRAADMAMAQKMNELMSGVETTQRGEMKDISTGALTGLGVDRAAGEAARKDKMQVLSTGRGNDLTAASNEAQRKTLERGQDLQYRSAMAQVAATAARNNMELTANQRASIADKALDNVNSTLKANMKLQIEVGRNPALMQQLLKSETERLMSAAGGTTMPAAPGAARPGGTTRMQFDAKGNLIQ